MTEKITPSTKNAPQSGKREAPAPQKKEAPKPHKKDAPHPDHKPGAEKKGPSTHVSNKPPKK